MDLVELSRLQFALTALYHFLFVPLTLGLSWILVIMEAVYLMTGKQVYKDMTRFWGKLFGINFALGVTTGLTMEFQFGTNWAYYSHYVGDIFGAPLAIEGLMAFFLEATLVGLFFFGWQRMSRRQHFLVTLFMALGTNLSALWILVANGWMQDPVGASFNFHTMRMELDNFATVFFNNDAQNKFLHTVSAGYTLGAMFVMSVSSWYILKKQDLEFAKKSFRIGAGFGLAAILSTLVLGDESGYTVGEVQQTKLAAMEAMWDTEPAPASFNLVAIPNEKEMKNDFAIKIPYLMGIIGTRSLDKQIPGIKDIVKKNEARIISGREAVIALNALRKNRDDTDALATFNQHKADLGFGLLLKSQVQDYTNATPEQIYAVARSSIPKVLPMYLGFRIMVACGLAILLVFSLNIWFALKGTFAEKPWLLKLSLWALPLPWIAIECGWFINEYGRQPWTVYGVLPTALSASSLTVTSVLCSIIGFTVLYTGLMIVEIYLMKKTIKAGPGSLGTGRYANEEH